ncbi:hypothetical protein ES708_21300 [subsurface metagenome]
MPDMNSSMKFAILKLLDEGVKDYEVIASKVGCSVRWVQEVAAKRSEGSAKLLPATLEEDLNLVDELANDFDGKDAFAGGVRWLGKSLMFACRLLGQVSAIPTMGRTGELQELVVLAQAMTPKPATADPALTASLNNVSQSIAKMAAPKTPEGMMFEAFLPMMTGVLANVMAAMGQKMPGVGQPGQTTAYEQSPGATEYRREAGGGYSKSEGGGEWQKVVDETELNQVKQIYEERG